MKISDFEFCNVVTSFAAWLTYILLVKEPVYVYSLLCIVASGLCSWSYQHRYKNETPDSFGHEHAGLLALLMTTPMLVTLGCIVLGVQLEEAYWVFMMSSWALGQSIASFLYTRRLEY